MPLDAGGLWQKFERLMTMVLVQQNPGCTLQVFWNGTGEETELMVAEGRSSSLGGRRCDDDHGVFSEPRTSLNWQQKSRHSYENKENQVRVNHCFCCTISTDFPTTECG